MNQSTSVNQDKNMRKVALTALAGTSIEWYDFFLYGAAAALIFPTAFFGEIPETTALILSLLTFAAGFIARPIGGIIFGHFGDRVGRKKTLIAALMLMGISSTLIGLLPTYAMIGVTAPILLTLLRFAQGLAIGGQWGGAMLLVTESAPSNQRGYYGAFAQAGAPIGVILANYLFDLDPFQFSEKARSGPNLFVSEIAATFGLLLVILLSSKEKVAATVAAYIGGAYWFTSSTSFANPAGTIGRSFSNTFAGISPSDILHFCVAQLIGALLALFVYNSFFKKPE